MTPSLVIFVLFLLFSTEDASWVTRSSETLTWSEGTLVSKALKLLQLYLQRHDSSPTHRYHLVVLEKVLATTTTNSSGGGGGSGKSLLLPEFLVDFLKKNQPQALLTSLIKFDKLDLALKYSLETIQVNTSLLLTLFFPSRLSK